MRGVPRRLPRGPWRGTLWDHWPATHAIHLDCLAKHADAYLDRLGIPNPNDEDDERTQGMDIDAFMQVCQERFLYRTLGAPCPACRMEFPMRHMQVFDEGRPMQNVFHEAPGV